MEYKYNNIENKWQKYWKQNKTYETKIDHSKIKFYVLDMFPYPSGAGLHVGHPLGYIASDIYARYKRLKGFNVLHPMGFDAFGLPAEQYAMQTGQHPAMTTENNIKKYKEQLTKFGFSYDWSREVRTCAPKYYKWTQWTFIKLFHHWYNKSTQKAESIESLISEFKKNGNAFVNAACSDVNKFSATEWKNENEKFQQDILMKYRLAYLLDTTVNWCPELGTVLANDEVSEGLSVRGGHPVIKKTMKQWQLRITAYADRLLDGLDKINWSDSIKDMQRNWIGKSLGASVKFKSEKFADLDIEVFTTRPDTIFGVAYICLAPENELVMKITEENYLEKIKKYVSSSINKSERERMTEIKKISGEFTGSYALHPFSGEKLPVYVADYILGGYGTGAVMAVPAHDSRDYAFAKHFKLPVKEVITGGNIETEAWEEKEGKLINSDFINDLHPVDASKVVIKILEKNKIGAGKTIYKLRDAIFSRQRYWGEPFPVYYKDGIAFTLPEEELPLLLPEVDKYLSTETGKSPLARVKNWKTKEGYPLETDTMPGFAGSSGYYFRYMDPHNEKEYFSKESVEYWQNVDFYVGGTEHATGHLMYARFWNKFLYDIGLAVKEEPFEKLINQGMIQGRSNIIYLNKDKTNEFISAGLKKYYNVAPIHIDINIVKNDILNIEAFKKWRPEFANAEFVLEDGKYHCGVEIEKMSKSLYNVVNPDALIERYGADTLRLYEMFLGPVEQSKPWDTKGIEGVFRFLHKFWKLFFDDKVNFNISSEEPTKEEYKILHKTIKKVEQDIERFSLNTAVSAFMICVNELSAEKCNKKEILEPLVVLISSFAPHISEELWSLMGHNTSVFDEEFPAYNDKFLQEDTFLCPVSVNGKLRFKIEIPVKGDEEEIKKTVLSQPEAQKWIEGKEPKKVIIVSGKIINIVV